MTIFNRTDEDVDMLKDFTVSLLDAAGNVVWSQVVMESPKPSVTLAVPYNEGRFVKVQLNGKGELPLAEVIVK